MPADLFTNTDFQSLYGKFSIVHATAVFHLFEGEKQAIVARQCLRLLKHTTSSTAALGTDRRLILGAQVGNVTAGDTMRKDGVKRYRHNEDSWRKLWEDVSGEAEFRDDVKSVEVGVIMEEQKERFVLNKAGDGQNEQQQQKHVGSVEDGFRWMIWHVWVEI